MFAWRGWKPKLIGLSSFIWTWVGKAHFLLYQFFLLFHYGFLSFFFHFFFVTHYFLFDFVLSFFWPCFSQDIQINILLVFLLIKLCLIPFWTFLECKIHPILLFLFFSFNNFYQFFLMIFSSIILIKLLRCQSLISGWNKIKHYNFFQAKVNYLSDCCISYTHKLWI